MPKTRIREIDSTGSVLASAISNTVFVPVKLTEDSEITTPASLSAFSPTLVASKTALDAIYVAHKAQVADSLDYYLCLKLINIGFDVLVQGFITDTGMTDNDQVALQDKVAYDIRFLTNGCFTPAAIPTGIVSCAANRGDCVALCNASETLATFTDWSATIVRGKFTNLTTISDIDPSFAAGFTPWFKVSDENLSTYTIPAAFGYLFAYANSLSNNNAEWLAIAGFDRGQIPNLVSVLHDYSAADIEVLQGRSTTVEVDLESEYDNNGFAVNPIAYIRPSGYILYGNRTLKVPPVIEESEGVYKSNGELTAQAFLNIRNMANAVKKKLYEAANKFRFEQNTEILWINFQAYITPLLDKMKSGNGIADYRQIRQATSAKARLKARLSIVPIEAVEDFDLEVYLTDTLDLGE